jgi:RNA polymerase sigma factor (sigma-70 family)
MTEPSDEFAALLGRARDGDQGALEQLARQYEAKVRIVARVLLGPALRPYLDSVDLVQSVHRSLLLGLRDARFDVTNSDRLMALALTMVRRKVARAWRRMRRQRRTDGGAHQEDLCELLTSLTAPDSDPAKAAQLNDQIRHLWSHLDATEQRMLELRMQDYSTDEMARELSLNPVALRVRLSRLRQRLRDGGVVAEWL